MSIRGSIGCIYVLFFGFYFVGNLKQSILKTQGCRRWLHTTWILEGIKSNQNNALQTGWLTLHYIWPTCFSYGPHLLKNWFSATSNYLIYSIFILQFVYFLRLLVDNGPNSIIGLAQRLFSLKPSAKTSIHSRCQYGSVHILSKGWFEIEFCWWAIWILDIN